MSMKDEAVRDDRGVSFMPLRRPFKVVSLVPSWTETLFDLGLTEEEIVGRTDYCVHPMDHVGRIEAVGGPKDPDIQKIFRLQPDLIIADREENRREDIEQFEKHWTVSRVFLTGPTTVNEALQDVERLGRLFLSPKRARRLVENVRAWRARVVSKDRGTVAYLVWQDPLMAASRETYIGDVLEILGYKNVMDRSTLKDLNQTASTRYPTVTLERLILLRPATILLSTEPFPFREAHADDLRSRLYRLDGPYAESVKIRIVNGEHYSWYGSRMVPAFRYFAKHHGQL